MESGVLAQQYFDALTGAKLDALPPDCWRCVDSDAPTWLVGAAFFDPQVNGFGGVDFQSPNITRDELEHAAETLQKAGCAHFLLTLITAEADFLEDQFKRLNALIDQSALLKAAIPGFHLEGPFISREEGYYGAHPPEHVIEPDADQFERWQQAAGGRIRMLTLAPEVPGALRVIRHAAERGVFVALGHSDAGVDDLVQAIDAGARLFTHLGNGMPLLAPRHDNIVQRVLSQADLWASVIPDGVHVPPVALSNLVRVLGPARVMFTTDASSPAGAGPGRYTLGSLELMVGDDGIVRHPQTSLFAGSSLTPLAGFYRCVQFGGVSADAAWRGWTRLRRVLFPELAAPMMALPVGWA